ATRPTPPATSPNTGAETIDRATIVSGTLDDTSAAPASAGLSPVAPPPRGGSPRSPSALTAPIPQPSVILWAAAVSPDGKFRIEARTGRRARLIRADSNWRLDLSSHEITCVSFAPDSRT